MSLENIFMSYAKPQAIAQAKWASRDLSILMRPLTKWSKYCARLANLVKTKSRGRYQSYFKLTLSFSTTFPSLRPMHFLLPDDQCTKTAASYLLCSSYCVHLLMFLLTQPSMFYLPPWFLPKLEPIVFSVLATLGFARYYLTEENKGRNDWLITAESESLPRCLPWSQSLPES